MGDVKRYTMDENSLMGGMDMFEDDDGEYVLHSDYDTILARHNALVEAVAWERETALHWEFGPVLRDVADDEAIVSMFAARADVDRLIADCKGEK